MRPVLCLLSFLCLCKEANLLDATMNIDVDWIHVKETPNKFGHLPEYIKIRLPVDPGRYVTIELHRKDDDYKNIPVILGGDDGHTLWESHEDERFHVYSDNKYKASFTVALNNTSEELPKITYFGSFMHKGRLYSLRPGKKEHVHHEILQHFHITIHNHAHVLVEDKPVERHHDAKDYFTADEL